MDRLSKRHGRILEILGREGTVTIAELAGRLEVSAETVRRDVRPLADRGTLVRMHGAVGLAGSAGEAPFQRRMGENATAKQRIARSAAALVRNGDSLALDTGTTTSFLARALTRHERLEIVTNSTDIARTLAGRNGNRVHLLGGRFGADSGALLGPDTVEAMQKFRVDHAVISAGAISSDGVMDYDPDEAAFARAVLASGRRRVVVCDSSKFCRSALVRVCPLAGIEILVTEVAPVEALAAALAEAKVAVTIAQARPAAAE
ncbi:DeoR/GlpR family DNA-binding transcription regulator [Palleronia sp. KMU-117]|uniref:DeoR/GlpR family DNA-binding transcription regulator n=1 Tax=Palleronia sp. KMU-117 TaxID=3434108 RepID=UPI003D706CD7